MRKIKPKTKKLIMKSFISFSRKQVKDVPTS